MMAFNLIEEPWIPCVDDKGGSVERGIRYVLNNAHKLREIFDPSPLVTTALHRLLLAVLYRALGGFKDFEEWRKIYEAGSFDTGKINSYLDNRMDRFYLFHPRHPFYQVPGLETDEEVTVARLATELASGHNTTLFDHTSEFIDFSFTYPEAARYLVACQAFALGFGQSAEAKINGVIEKRPYSKDAVALRGMNVWIQGKTLFHTLAINVYFLNDTSLPPWEMDAPHVNRDEKKSEGIIDILTWQSRLIRLVDDGGRVRRMFFTQGRASDKEERKDPMKVYIKTKNGYKPLGLEEGKAAWRDYYSISMTRNPVSGEKRPECFNLLSRAIEEGVIEESEIFTTHVTGLATIPGKAGKFVLWRHERLPLPAVLTNSDFLEMLGIMIESAETAAESLRKRMMQILRFYLETKTKPPSQEELNKFMQSLNPLPQYWASLEQGFYDLLRDLPQDWDYENERWKDEKDLKAQKRWYWHIKREAQRALEESVRMMGNTERAVRAIEMVGTKFTNKDLGLAE